MDPLFLSAFSFRRYHIEGCSSIYSLPCSFSSRSPANFMSSVTTAIYLFLCLLHVILSIPLTVSVSIPGHVQTILAGSLLSHSTPDNLLYLSQPACTHFFISLPETTLLWTTDPTYLKSCTFCISNPCNFTLALAIKSYPTELDSKERLLAATKGFRSWLLKQVLWGIYHAEGPTFAAGPLAVLFLKINGYRWNVPSVIKGFLKIILSLIYLSCNTNTIWEYIHPLLQNCGSAWF